MKRLSLTTAKRVIALLILMAAAALPGYSQEMQGSPIDVGQAGSRFALSAGETPAVPGKEDANQSTGASQTNSTSPIPNTSLTPSTSPKPNTSPTPNTSQMPSASATPTRSPTTSAPFIFPTRRERFNRYVKSTVGPFRLLRTAFSAGINQWRDNPEEWEQGMSGYGKRFASGFGRNAIQQTIVYGLDSALGLDTGFRRSSHKGFFRRMKDALSENITSRTRTGKRVISVPRISGAYASTVIAAETWYPERYNYKDGLRNGSYLLLTGFGMNLIREFVIKF